MNKMITICAVIVLLLSEGAPASAQNSRFGFTNPGAAAVDALVRSTLCQDIIRAGGTCDPSGPESTEAMSGRFTRLVNYNAQMLRQQQQADQQLQTAVIPITTQIVMMQAEIESMKGELRAVREALVLILEKLK